MGVEGKNHGTPIETPRSFAQAAMEVLEWRKAGFTGSGFEASDTPGKDEVRKTFIPREGVGDVPKRLIHVLRFLANRMKIDDGGQLRNALDEAEGLRQPSVVDLERRGEPDEILRRLLAGEYDEKIEASGIARRGEVYTIALFLYMNTTGDSEDEMTNALARLLAKYDDPKSSQYDVDIDGLGVEPYLAELCATAIERNHLQQKVRTRTQAILQDEVSPESGRFAIGQSNLNRVIPPAA
jgi:hypothetical protein